MEAHCVSHARTRLEGDADVNRVINCSVSREENFTRKKCTTTEAEAEFLRAVNMNTVQREIVQQGRFLELAEAENEDMVWKS